MNGEMGRDGKVNMGYGEGGRVFIGLGRHRAEEALDFCFQRAASKLELRASVRRKIHRAAVVREHAFSYIVAPDHMYVRGIERAGN